MDHHDKLAWASRHIDALEKAISDFSNSNPYHVVRNFNDETGEHEASILEVPDIAPDWGLMVGDIVHGLRSSLDNVTYALAVRESGRLPADTSTRLQYPVADTPQGWIRNKDRVALLSPLAQAEIEGQQPCNGLDKTKPHFLSVLRDLNNTDKHRRLNVVLVKASDVTLSFTGSGIPAGTKIAGGFRGPLEANTIIAKWSFTPVTPPDMDVHCEFVINVEFGYEPPAPRQPVLDVLNFIRNHIRDDVFPPLDKLLG
jgi:hypothetical protein